MILIIIFGLLLSSNAYADTMNVWIGKGYKVKNEDIVIKEYVRSSTKIFTLMNKKGYIVICTVRISSRGTIEKAICVEQWKEF